MRCALTLSVAARSAARVAAMAYSGGATKHHDLHGFLRSPTPATDEAALVVLNSASFGAGLLEKLWAASTYRVCADGGANRLFDLLAVLRARRDRRRPRQRGVLEAYAAGGAAVARVEDQDANDLSRPSTPWPSAGAAAPRRRGRPRRRRFGGRFDQEMAAFDALHKFAARDRDASMALYSDENAATLLAPGPSHEIVVRHDAEGPHCGLVPLGAPCEWVTTAGLQWNLDGGALAFGDLVSTSNLVPRDGGRGESVVSVACAAPLVWTIARRGDS
ncbi:hypothetical protein JL721_10631 [Aureococcus anophagefferens]|nr:hypothetical protein JL721_10631 [Aureococcus anophagefferens]